MQRSWPKFAVAALIVGVLFAGTSTGANDTPFAGNWKVTEVSSGNEIVYFLIQVEETAGKPQAKVLAAPLLRGNVDIQNLKSDGKSIEFDAKSSAGTFHTKAYLPRADAKTKDILGSIAVGSSIRLAQFVKTDDKELTREDAVNETEQGKQLIQARSTRDVKKQQGLLKELIEKNADKPLAHTAYEALLQSYSKEVPKDEDMVAAAEQFVKSGARFGPEVEHHAVLSACQALARAMTVSPAAVDFIQKAEKSLTRDTPPSQSALILKSLARALKKTGKDKESRSAGAAHRQARSDARRRIREDRSAIQAGRVHGPQER